MRTQEHQEAEQRDEGGRPLNDINAAFMAYAGDDVRGRRRRGGIGGDGVGGDGVGGDGVGRGGVDRVA
jgi:hypothetical protein